MGVLNIAKQRKQVMQYHGSTEYNQTETKGNTIAMGVLNIAKKNQQVTQYSHTEPTGNTIAMGV